MLNDRKNVGGDSQTHQQGLIGHMVTEKTITVGHPVSHAVGLASADALDRLCQELADEAIKLSGAYRSAVRLVSPDGKTLGVAVAAPRQTEFWPDDFIQKRVSFEEDCAATWAMHLGSTYIIEDTTAKDIHFEPVPPTAGSHAAIILKSGVQALGILSLDWREPHGFNENTIKSLETLAERYSTAISSCGMDQIFRRIEETVKGHEVNGEFSADYKTFLRIVADMLGTNQGALFIRRPGTGRYHLAAHLTHPEYVERQFSDKNENSYESGFGLTGWIAKHNRPLMLGNIDNPSELRAIADDLKWGDKVIDGANRDDRNLSYLGVPIAVGVEVLGVLRLASSSKGRFTSNDLQIALAAAARLAGYLYEQAEARRMRALLQLAARVASANSQKELARDIFNALTEGLEDCACHIRVLDQFQREKAEIIPVLRRLAVSRAEWETAPHTRRKGEGIAGRVWAERRTIVYRDVDKEPLVQQAMSEDLQTTDIVAKVGSGACVPIEADGDFIGTLHVHKRFRHSLSPREIIFVEEIARLAGSALLAAGKREDERLRSDFQAVTDEFLQSVLRSASVQNQEQTLLIKVLDAVHRNLGTLSAWLRVPNELRSHFKCIKVRGDVSGDDVPDVSIEHAMHALPELFGVSNWTTEDPVATFITPRLSSQALNSGKAYGCAILLETDRPFALFSFVVESPDLISYSRVERVTKMLGPLAEVILLAQRFEHTMKELEVTTPLALMGAMFSRLEHELRSPVTNLKGAIDNIMTGEPSDLEVREMLVIMKEERDKLQSVLEQMIYMVGRSRTPFVAVSLTSCISSVIEEFKKESQGQRLDFHSSEQRITVEGIAEYLRVAFRFVIKNALEAVEARGAEGCVVVTVTRLSGGSCKITVDDNGGGMVKDKVHRALEPFYTTKSNGGTGLGLPAAFCIVRSHGGQLTFDSEDHKGSRITIVLPLAKGENIVH